MLACSQEKGLLTIFPQTFSACASQVSPSSPLTGAQQLLRETDNVPFTQIELCHGESRFHLSNYRYLNKTIRENREPSQATQAWEQAHFSPPVHVGPKAMTAPIQTLYVHVWGTREKDTSLSCQEQKGKPYLIF